MSRYIDVDRLKKRVCSVCENEERCKDRETVCSVFAEIDEQPTVDVKPVIYAKAIKFYDDSYTGRMFTTCSACDGKISSRDAFCKHCGATIIKG